MMPFIGNKQADEGNKDIILQKEEEEEGSDTFPEEDEENDEAEVEGETFHDEDLGDEETGGAGGGVKKTEHSSGEGNDEDVVIKSSAWERYKESHQKRNYRLWSAGAAVCAATVVALIIMVIVFTIGKSSPSNSTIESSSTANSNGNHPSLGPTHSPASSPPKKDTAVTVVDDAPDSHDGAATSVNASAVSLPTPAPTKPKGTATTTSSHAPATSSTTAPHTTSTTTAPHTTTATTATSTTSTTSGTTNQGCLSDRFDNENMKENSKLYPGQYICSRDEDRRYRFGLTETGDLVLEDMQKSSKQVLYENTQRRANRQDPTAYQADYFVSLQTDGTLVMHKVEPTSTTVNNTTVHHEKTTRLWKAKPKFEMSLTESCIDSHDCPFMHLHKQGIMVVNWVNGTNVVQDWQEKNFLHVYDF